MTYLKQLWTVSMWEYKRFFKIKNELIGIAIMLIVSLIMIWGGSFIKSLKSDVADLTVIDNIDNSLVSALETKFNIIKVPLSDQDKVIERIVEDHKGNLLLINEDSYEFISWKEPAQLSLLKSILNEYHRDLKMTKLGITEDNLKNIFSPIDLETTYLEGSISRNSLVYFFTILTVMAITLSFSYQSNAITGEKRLKITEQIISAIKPQTWMDGKIVGITITALSSMLLYSIIGILAGVIYFQITNKPLSILSDILHFPSILIFLIFSIMGILMWNALLAAISSMVIDPNNSSKMSLMLIPILFITLSMIIPPHHKAASILSWFPLTSSNGMPMRWVVDVVPWWQLIASFTILVLTFFALRVLAAKIFRVSILMSGKEPTWREIFKMIKAK